MVSELLQQPNEALNSAHPAAGLPKLQAALFGSAAMGYGDLFVAGLFGGLLARGWEPRARLDGRALDPARRLRDTRTRQLRAAVLVTGLALAFDLLFFAVDELPATVPVALALIVAALARAPTRESARLAAAPPRPP